MLSLIFQNVIAHLIFLETKPGIDYIKHYASEISIYNFTCTMELCVYVYHRQAGLHIRVDIQTTTKGMDDVSVQ